MRIAHLQSRLWYKTPREEYDGIALTIARYREVLTFADKNLMGDSVDAEVRLAREMVTLLPNKQRDIQAHYAKSS
jgi:hypothetical protein